LRYSCDAKVTFLFRIPPKYRYCTSVPDYTASHPVFTAVRMSNLTQNVIIFPQGVNQIYPWKHPLLSTKQCSV